MKRSNGRPAPTKSARPKTRARLEKQIQELETKQAELAAELEKPESYEGGRAMEINRELMHVVDDLAAKTAEWETAATKLTELDAPETKAEAIDRST